MIVSKEMNQQTLAGCFFCRGRVRPEEAKDNPPVPSTAEGLSHPSSTSATIRAPKPKKSGSSFY